MKEIKIDSQEPPKTSSDITKLAIGKPGGADFSNEKWELHLNLHCYDCNSRIPTDLNTKIDNIVKYILNCSSASEKESIKAWELEIHPCEHSLYLHQTSDVQILSKDEAKCNNCSLNSNLWLCLTCGNLGCGRKQHDGSGGNSHGIEHFKSTGHPLSVKTGTITPQGDACNIIELFIFSCLLL